MNRRLPAASRDRGAAMILVAVLLPVLVIMTAFAVDLGELRTVRRDMQAAADVISLDMARLADGRTLAEIEAGDPSQPPAATALAASADRNEVDVSQLMLDWGVWDATSGYQSINADPALVPNAAKVVATGTADSFFSRTTGTAQREAVGVYGDDDWAGFSVGSFVASMSFSHAQLLDDLLSPYLDDQNPVDGDAPVELDAVSYQGLADADVTLGDLATELGATTSRELLETSVALDDFMLAAANVLRNEGRTAEADLVEGSISAKMGDFMVNVLDLVSADSGAEDAAMVARIDLPTVIQAAVFQSQCSTSASGFEECTGITIPTLTASLPLVSSSGSLKLIESERYHFGRVGSGVDTSQFQTDLDAVIGSQNVGRCTPDLLLGVNCLLNGILVDYVDAVVTIDATITLAGGRTTIDQIDCADPTAMGLLLGSNTGLYGVDLDVTVDFGTRGLLGGLLGTTLGTMTFEGGTTQVDTLENVLFTVAPDILGETLRSTGQGDPGMAGLSLTSTGSTGILSDLATLNIDYTIDDVLSNLIDPALSDMDARVLSPLSEMLGLNVAGSDLIAHALSCDPGFVKLAE